MVAAQGPLTITVNDITSQIDVHPLRKSHHLYHILELSTPYTSIKMSRRFPIIFLRRGRRHRNSSRSFCKANHRSSSTTMSASPATVLLLLFFLGAIGVVSPFAGGSTADVGGTTHNSHKNALDAHRHRRQQQQGSVAHQLYPPQHQPHAGEATTTSSSRAAQSPLFRNNGSASSTTSLSVTAAAAASTASSPSPPSPRPQDETKKQSSSLFRRIVWNLNPLSGRKDDRWKGGESKATVASRLLFSYVSPLLDVAANRTLTDQDALGVAPNSQMDVAVEGLADTYDRARQKAHHQIEVKRQRHRQKSGGSSSSNAADRVKLKNSQTWILLKALFQYQRSTLISTGCLRLLNTGIQAFPAIIVARLLRSIEAGTAEPVTKSVHAALLLVAVLSTKMIVENQLFHNVVNMSTQVRGALEGLIFDKSLRLPEGGSGVLAKQNLSDEKKALGSGGVSGNRMHAY